MITTAWYSSLRSVIMNSHITISKKELDQILRYIEEGTKLTIPCYSPLYPIADFLIGTEEMLKHYEDKNETLENETTSFKRTIVHLNGLTPPGVDPNTMDPDLCVMQLLINKIPNETLELRKVQRQLYEARQKLKDDEYSYESESESEVDPID